MNDAARKIGQGGLRDVRIAPPALVMCCRIVFAENRFPLFRTML
jgi:hypothetical protein